MRLENISVAIDEKIWRPIWFSIWKPMDVVIDNAVSLSARLDHRIAAWAVNDSVCTAVDTYMENALTH